MNRTVRCAAALGAVLFAARAEAGPPEAVFRAPAWPLTIHYPADLEVSPRFKTNYFTDGSWRMSYAAGPGAGEPIVAFSLPDRHAQDEGGDSVAQLELTIGASRDRSSLATCLRYGMNSGNNVEEKTRVIGGVSFTEVPDNSDGGMMKSVMSDDYRAVHDGVCWAIDLVVFVEGTSNHRPSFTPAEMAHVKSVLDGIRFQAEP